MKAYEMLFFIDPQTGDEDRAGAMARLEATIKDGGGKVDSVDAWGKKKLAYAIDDLGEGDYTLVNFEADPAQIAELDRICRISDVIKRHMIVRRPLETKEN